MCAPSNPKKTGHGDWDYFLSIRSLVGPNIAIGFVFLRMFFTESAPRPIQSIIRDVRMKCVKISPTSLPELRKLETSGQRAYH